MARVLGIEGGNLDLLGQGGRQLDDLLELALRVAHHRRQLHRVLDHVPDQVELRAQVRIGLGVFLDADPPEALDQHAHGVVGELEHLQHSGGATDLVHLVRLRVLGIGVALKRDPQQPVTAHDIVDELGALGGLHEQGSNHAREDDDIR